MHGQRVGWYTPFGLGVHVVAGGIRPASADRVAAHAAWVPWRCSPGPSGAAVTEGVVTAQPTRRREACMAPVCILCKQPISSANPGKPVNDEWRHFAPCPTPSQRTNLRQRVAQLWRVVTAWLRR